ncbi:sulfotransferase family 2 domain-containing protein [Synechocystis sp. PCC 7509]|uniref:sulfotransferase family 2 domain-containing protein n=1 Tax=Synechocystis sp. PCC 7509 TaxID=927677 RepID=UPI0002ABAA02|nr:sulfotransferase family 2 domain-containing protein [Synechocystis sp. PCC 7509]
MQKLNNTALIFLHLPKTAGSTLNNIISRQYNSKNIYNLYGNADQILELTENFKHLSEKQHQNIKVIKGHICYGFHELLVRPATYVTLLREPVDRAISLYYYIRRHPAHRHYELITSKNMSLDDYIYSGVATQLDNGQTRMIAGVDANKVEFGKCSVAMLEKAKKNINTHFSFVGTTSKFDESLMLLKNYFSWSLPLYQKQNVTKNRPETSDILNSTLNVIKDLNKLDIELYKYAETKIEQQIEQQDFLAKELKAFNFVNNVIYANYLKVKHKLLIGG